MFKRLCIVLFLFILQVGCSNTQVESPKSYSKTEKDLPASTSIQQLTKETISDRYKNATDIHFEDYKRTDNVNYLSFSFKNNRSPYYGFTVAGKKGDRWELAYFEDIPNDQKETIMIYQFIGTYPGTDNREFHITAGFVNSKQISQVYLYYPNSNFRIIKLAKEQYGFLDVDMDPKNSLLKIEGRSNNEKTLYKKDFKIK